MMELSTIKCLIVDDEPLALELLETYVRKTPFLQLKGKCANALEAMQMVNAGGIDLLFLDIQMPELNGIELKRILQNTVQVVFTTAFSHYAVDGFKVDAIDYLLKPFNYEEFLKAANKAKDYIELRSDKAQSAPEEAAFLFVKSEYKQVKITLADILYIEGLKDYVKIWLKSQAKPILTLMSLKTLEEELPSRNFMRIHRSFIIALDKIDAIERSQVLIGPERITVAEQYKEKFQAFLSNNSIH